MSQLVEKTTTKMRSKSEEKRQKILLAATEIFCDKGFLASSMNHIAKLAGVSKQTVYSHFGNKDELFVAAIRARCSDFKMSSLPASIIDDPQLTLQFFANAFISLLLSKEGLAMHRICISESRTNPLISQLYFAAGPELVIAEISDLFVSYQQKKLLKIDNVHIAAMQFLSMIKGEALIRREYNTEKQLTTEQINAYNENSVNFFLRGYGYKFKPSGLKS